MIRLVARSGLVLWSASLSNASGTLARTSAAAADDVLAESFRVAAFAASSKLPTVPGGTGSSTSPNSVFINV